MAKETSATKTPAPTAAVTPAVAAPKPAKSGGSTISLSHKKSVTHKSDAQISANAKKHTAKLTGLLAIVRIRGVTGMNPKRQHTLELLNIPQSHNATLVPANPIYLGMIHQAKDYISWGPISEHVLESMLTKRGRTDEGRKLREAKKPHEIKEIAAKLIAGSTLKSLEVRRTFHLTPPSGGFKDRKKNYPIGDLGPRPSMDDAIKSMI
ncbi:50S ribosomal protein L30 [uncultured archaeon]|nr:50S ribosomal protein L30 [uncultured archaeon]